MANLGPWFVACVKCFNKDSYDYIVHTYAYMDASIRTILGPHRWTTICMVGDFSVKREAKQFAGQWRAHRANTRIKSANALAEKTHAKVYVVKQQPIKQQELNIGTGFKEAQVGYLRRVQKLRNK
jgi:aspartate carbamoyltransferase catalytic subunit